jgi:hypothetical protein
MGHFKLVIDTNALLIANGTEQDSIYFSTIDTAMGWHGLRFYKADSNCQLSYCFFEYAKTFEGVFENGGAIYSRFTDLIVDHCKFKSNAVLTGMGEGIYFENGKIALTNSELIDNFCALGGSGFFCYNSIVMINRCFFDHDSTWYIWGGDFGGGITLTTCKSIEISDCTIRRCFSGQGGGGICIMSSLSDSVPVAITDNAIYNNKSVDVGAGIVITNSIVNLSGNLIYGDTTKFCAGNGAGVGFARCHLTMTNNVLANNYSLARGGAIWTRLGHTVMRNNIIWGNVDQCGMQIYVEEETISVAEYNDIQGGRPGIGNIDSDPLFDYPDTVNFQIGWANWPTDDSTKSPCIDTGDPNSPLDPDSTRADMGALFYNQRWNDISDNLILPDRFMLLDNYPNPFNFSTTIRYIVPTAGPVRLDIYDILGRKVQTLLDIIQPAGEYRVIWNANKVGSGAYFYRLTTDNNIISRPMILLK